MLEGSRVETRPGETEEALTAVGRLLPRCLPPVQDRREHGGPLYRVSGLEHPTDYARLKSSTVLPTTTVIIEILTKDNWLVGPIYLNYSKRKKTYICTCDFERNSYYYHYFSLSFEIGLNARRKCKIDALCYESTP